MQTISLLKKTLENKLIFILNNNFDCITATYKIINDVLPP